MVWKKSPLILCTAIETVVNLENSALYCNKPYQTYNLDNNAEAVVIAFS